MASKRKYRRKKGTAVTAVQLNLETEGFSFTKWGGTQFCKQGDWLVDQDGETHTVDKDSFARTYEQVGPGRYVKIAPVWAEVAESDGVIETKEGGTHYHSGDYLVYNEEDGGDGYAVTPGRFEEMYDEVE